MTRRLPLRLQTAALCCLLLAADGAVQSAMAGCNIIPPAVTTFRGSLGSLDRPYARPDDWVRILLDPSCASSSPGFGPSASDSIVTVVFTPPDGGPRNVVAIAANCAGVDIAGCTARPDVAAATCMPANQPGKLALEAIDGGSLRFRFPRADGGYQVANPGNLTLTGPATVAVTPAGAPLPCALASLPCNRHPGLLACVDSLFANNGTCNGQPHRTFSSFTALPIANDYRGLCTSPVPPCTGLTADLRFTVDRAGNVLIPMDWRGVRVDRDAVPVARLLRASSHIEAFQGRGQPILISDLDSLASYSPEGIVLPPLFDPQRDPTANGTATFFGSTDAEETVLRIARNRKPVNQCIGGYNNGLPCIHDGHCDGHTCNPPKCAGGANAGTTCTTHFDCPGSECGPGLFEFRGRLLGGTGPVVLRRNACVGGINPLTACTTDATCLGGQCGAFTMAALDPVPLDGLNQSDALSCFVMEEAIANADLNGDGDKTDAVVKLVDRSTGQIQAIGDGAAAGRAVVRVQQPPFSFPALAVEGDLIAFLEPEPLQGATDVNANGRVFDTVLRAYRLGGDEVTDPLAPVTADAAPLIYGRSLAISNGTVFFRSAEAAEAVQETTRVSVDSNGNQGTGGWQSFQGTSVSADGRYVAFLSDATNIVTPDINNGFDVFVRDRATAQTVRVSVNAAGVQSNNPNIDGAYISADGRYVAFGSYGANLAPGITNVGYINIFVHDRDADGNGIFDETGLGQRKTVQVSVASDGTNANENSRFAPGAISADGRFVAFTSFADNLVIGDTNGFADVFVHDRDADGNGIFDEPGPGQRKTVRVSVAADGQEGNADSRYPSMSADGRYIVFTSWACNLIPGDCVTSGDTNGTYDVYLHDRDADGNGIFDEPGGIATRLASVNSAGVQGNNFSAEASISADGSTVVFASIASNLVSGDTNSVRDIFAHDIASGQTTAVTVTPSGQMGNSNSGAPMANRDGRYVAFISRAKNLTAGVLLHDPLIYLHDRLNRLTTLVSVNMAGNPPNDWTMPAHSISWDGKTVAYPARATDIVPDDTNGMEDLFVRAPVPGSGDLSGDGWYDDVVLRALDTSTGPPSSLIDLCPAGATAVAGGRAAFLRPEGAGTTPGLALCPTAPLVGDNPDLNGDGDGDDDVVHFFDGSTVANLARAASDLVLSDTWIAAAVDERADGGADRNGDGDADDHVLHVHPAGAGAWTNVSRAARSLAIAGGWVAFLSDEAAQGGAVLNGDGDTDDAVVHVYDADAAQLTNVGQAAEELVIGRTGLVAFRTMEASQGNLDLNDDGDSGDGVLQVYDAAADLLLNSGQAVTPCRLEACDPRLPYRVRDDTVIFLTLEADQGVDLNGDGDLGDLVLQVLNVRQVCEMGHPIGACHAIAAASAGICTDTGAACVDDASCPAGECFVPPGGCLRNLGTPCNPVNGAGCNLAVQFCQPTLGSPGQGTCVQIGVACDSDADCTAPAFCSRARQDFNRLMDPLADTGGGALVFTGAGRCVETTATGCIVNSQCGSGGYCDGGVCRRQHGVCATDGDCPTGSTCRADLIRSTAADRDGDEIPDIIDNCPDVPNVMQDDRDGDGIGDACDPQTCGNGISEEGEDCDDGNTMSGDGCESDCSLSPTLIAATKLLLKDSPSGDVRSLVFVSKDQSGLLPPVGPDQDPTIGGARLQVTNDATGEEAFVELPAENWIGLGEPAGSKGYRYRDPNRLAGPCHLVLLRPGKIVKAACRGSDIAFTLNETQQGELRLALRSGAGAGALKYCARLGGTIAADKPVAVSGKDGIFKAVAAPRPAYCTP